jgi:hypothetical protein
MGFAVRRRRKMEDACKILVVISETETYTVEFGSAYEDNN